MGMILRIASSRIVGQGDIVGRSGYFSLNLSANSVMRGRLDARRTLKSLVADLRIMKQNIAKVFTFSLLASSISFISCVDNEKNLFDADQLKQIYEETFPVKNIDLDGDWTVSRSVIACVSVNGDQGVDYKIQIFDADPLSPGSTAKLLAEGTVNQSTTLNVVMDCATALDKVFVARIDEHKRYLVQPVAIENGTVTAHLGDAHYIWIYRSTTSHVEYREC